MASSCFHDIWAWIQNLPPITLWPTNSISVCIYSSKSTNELPISLDFSINRCYQNHTPYLFFSILAHCNNSTAMSLWSSKSFQLTNIRKDNISNDQETISSLLYCFIRAILSYGPTKNSFFIRIPSLDTTAHFKDIFNLSFFNLALLICIYEAPQDLRLGFLDAIQDHLTSAHSREVLKTLMRALGSNIEEEWMRSLNLGITNLILEMKASHQYSLIKLSPMFSYAISTLGLWKVQLYSPIITMDTERPISRPSNDARLWFSLWYQQLESVIQFGYDVKIQEEWVDVLINVDNIRCDVVSLASEALMAKRGAGLMEKYFPSRISLQLTPTLQTNILSVSVGKSSENPVHEIGKGMAFEGSFDPPNSLGLKISATEYNTMRIKPWKFEQSVYGYSANLNWFLHDSKTGMEVVSSKPPMLAICLPKVRFKNRYSSPDRPFNRQGGVVFAGDEYGERVLWKVDRSAIGKTMEWETKGCIWLTYWPNKSRAFYHETRKLEFKEILHISIA